MTIAPSWVVQPKHRKHKNIRIVWKARCHYMVVICMLTWHKTLNNQVKDHYSYILKCAVYKMVFWEQKLSYKQDWNNQCKYFIFVVVVPYPDSEREAMAPLLEFVTFINNHIEPLHMQIRKGISEDDGTSSYVLVTN